MVRWAHMVVLAAPLTLAGCPDRIAYLGGDCSDPVGHGGDPRTLPRACAGEDAGPDADAAADAADDGPDAAKDGG